MVKFVQLAFALSLLVPVTRAFAQDQPGESPPAVIAYWKHGKDLVVRDLSTDQETALPALPHAGDQYVAATPDLGTLVWSTDTSGGALLLRRDGRDSLMVTYDQLMSLNRSWYSDGHENLRYSAQLPTISSDGTLVSFSPTLATADGHSYGYFALHTADGNLVDVGGSTSTDPDGCRDSFGPTHVSFSTDDALTAGVITANIFNPPTLGVCRLNAHADTQQRTEALRGALELEGSRQAAEHTAPLGDVEWTPDDDTLLFALNGALREIDEVGPDGVRTTLYDDSDNDVPAYSTIASPKLSPDGTMLLFERRPNNQPTTVWVVALDGSAPRQLAEGARPFWVRQSAHI